MSVLTDSVTVNIKATSATPSLPGFGITGILGYHTHWTDLTRVYEDLPSMVTDGFSTTEPLYRMAQSIFQQNPHPQKVVVIRATTAAVHSFTLTVTDSTEGHSVGATIVGPDGTETACYHTVTTGQSTTVIADAVATLIDAISAIAADNSSAVITATGGTAGAAWYAYKIKGCDFADTTADANPEVDLSAALLVDSSWYGVSGEWLDAANIETIATWAQSNGRLHGYTTADSDNMAANDGIFDTLRDSARDHSFGLFSLTPQDYGGTGWLGGQLVPVPGSNNWAYKQIIRTPIDGLTATQRTNIEGSNGNYYVDMATVPVTKYGITASGQYIDITVGIDSLTQKVQLRVATLLTTMPKVPYTRKGIAAVSGAVRAALADSVTDGFLTDEAGFEPKVSVPALETITAQDKAARLLKNVFFTATAQGAVNKVTITGTVSL